MMQYKYVKWLQPSRAYGYHEVKREYLLQILSEKFGVDEAVFGNPTVSEMIDNMFAACGVDVYNPNDSASRANLPRLKAMFSDELIAALTEACTEGSRDQELHTGRGGDRRRGRSKHMKVDGRKLSEFMDYAVEHIGKKLAADTGETAVNADSLRRSLFERVYVQEILEKEQARHREETIRQIQELDAGITAFCWKFEESLTADARKALPADLKETIAKEMRARMLHKAESTKALVTTPAAELCADPANVKNLAFTEFVNLKAILGKEVYDLPTQPVVEAHFPLEVLVNYADLRDPATRDTRAGRLATEVSNRLAHYGKPENITAFVDKIRMNFPLLPKIQISHPRGGGTKNLISNSIAGYVNSEDERNGYAVLRQRAIDALVAEGVVEAPAFFTETAGKHPDLIAGTYSSILHDWMIAILRKEIGTKGTIRPQEDAASVAQTVKLRNKPEISVTCTPAPTPENDRICTVVIAEGDQSKTIQVVLNPRQEMVNFLNSVLTFTNNVSSDALTIDKVADTIRTVVPQDRKFKLDASDT